MLEPGIKNSKAIVVTEEQSAKQVGSGLLNVFATPSMITLMEATSFESVSPFLEEGRREVKTELIRFNQSHTNHVQRRSGMQRR